MSNLALLLDAPEIASLPAIKQRMHSANKGRHKQSSDYDSTITPVSTLVITGTCHYTGCTRTAFEIPFCYIHAYLRVPRPCAAPGCNHPVIDMNAFCPGHSSFECNLDPRVVEKRIMARQERNLALARKVASYAGVPSEEQRKDLRRKEAMRVHPASGHPLARATKESTVSKSKASKPVDEPQQATVASVVKPEAHKSPAYLKAKEEIDTARDRIKASLNAPPKKKSPQHDPRQSVDAEDKKVNVDAETVNIHGQEDQQPKSNGKENDVVTTADVPDVEVMEETVSLPQSGQEKAVAQEPDNSRIVSTKDTESAGEEGSDTYTIHITDDVSVEIDTVKENATMPNGLKLNVKVRGALISTVTTIDDDGNWNVDVNVDDVNPTPQEHQSVAGDTQPLDGIDAIVPPVKKKTTAKKGKGSGSKKPTKTIDAIETSPSRKKKAGKAKADIEAVAVSSGGVEIAPRYVDVDRKPGSRGNTPCRIVGCTRKSTNIRLQLCTPHRADLDNGKIPLDPFKEQCAHEDCSEMIFVPGTRRYCDDHFRKDRRS